MHTKSVYSILKTYLPFEEDQDGIL